MAGRERQTTCGVLVFITVQGHSASLKSRSAHAALHNFAGRIKTDDEKLKAQAAAHGQRVFAPIHGSQGFQPAALGLWAREVVAPCWRRYNAKISSRILRNASGGYSVSKDLSHLGRSDTAIGR